MPSLPWLLTKRIGLAGQMMTAGLTPPLGMLIFAVSGVPATAPFRAVVPYLQRSFAYRAILWVSAIIF